MYRLTQSGSVIRMADGACIPADPANTDYQQFLKDQAEGAVVEPYTPPDGRPAVLAEYRTLRETYLNRLTGIAVREDPVIGLAARTMMQGLLDLPEHASVTSAADGPAMKAAIMARYKALVAAAIAAAPGSKAVFDKVSK